MTTYSIETYSNWNTLASVIAATGNATSADGSAPAAALTTPRPATPGPDAGIFATGSTDTAFNISGSLILSTLYWEKESYMYWICSVLAAAGVVGHFLTVIVMAASKKLFHELSSFRDLLISQCCADWLTCACVLLHTAIPLPVGGAMSPALCHIWANKLLLWIALSACTYSLAFFAVERYLELLHPAAHEKLFTGRRFLFVALGLWLFAIGWSNANQFTTRLVLGVCIPFTFWPNTTAMYWFLGLSAVFRAVLPTCAACFCFGNMHHHYSERVGPTLAEVAGLNKQSDRQRYTRKRVMKILTWIAAFYLVFLAWFEVNQFLIGAGSVRDIQQPQYHTSIAGLLAVLAAKPVVYFANVYQMEAALKRLVFCERRTWTQEAVKMDGPSHAHRWGDPVNNWAEARSKPWTPNYTGNILL